MKVSPKLHWMTPYLHIGLKHVPQGKKVTRLSWWRFNGRFGKGSHACIFTNDYKEYRIYLKDTYQRKDMPQAAPFSKIDMLHSLAHELAHMLHMDHTPEHKKLEAKILSAYMTQLRKDGYISEEHELQV